MQLNALINSLDLWKILQYQGFSYVNQTSPTKPATTHNKYCLTPIKKRSPSTHEMLRRAKSGRQDLNPKSQRYNCQ